MFEIFGGLIGKVAGGLFTAAGGGLFGLIGSLAGQWLKSREKQKEHRREIELVRLQMEVKKQEGSWRGLTSSHQSDAAVSSNAHKWANDIKAIYRPLLTTLLCRISYLIFRDLMAAMNGEGSTIASFFEFEEIRAMVVYCVYSIIFATSTAVVWWYGDRAFAPPGLK